uniref:5'-AMP-activated protein kinase subunit gamma-1 n=1 Tax=Macrostomum lignano TaxID=282301 RepID=A0A1I8IR83_9PLAT
MSQRQLLPRPRHRSRRSGPGANRPESGGLGPPRRPMPTRTAADPAGKRSSVRQFFDNFRPRAVRRIPARCRRQSVGLIPAMRTARTSDVEASATLGVKKRSKSPMGSLVNRLKLLATDTGERRRSWRGIPPVQGLPHPSDIPLDTAYLAQHHPGERGDEQSFTISADDAFNPGPVLHSISNSHGRVASPPNVRVPQRRWHLSFVKHNNSSSNNSSISELGQDQRGCDEASRCHFGCRYSLRLGCIWCSRREQPGRSASPVRTKRQRVLSPLSKSRRPTRRPAAGAPSHSIEPSRVFEIFSQKHRCYDLIPTSSKLLVFDHNLNVKKAFFALVYNGLRAAPVWDSDQQRFVGMLTITDFINILHNFYRSALVPMEELESHRISTWRAQLQDRLRPFLWISPEASLLDAVRLLLHARVHRLPVVEPRTGNALFILTHKRILKYIYLYMHQLPMPPWLDASLRQLRIGTYEGIRTITESTPLVKVLSLFVLAPCVNLAATKTYNNLDVSVKDALQYRRDRFEGVTSCQPDDSLRSVLEKLVTAEVHRLVIVDSDQQVIGVVSLSDILKAIVLDHKALAESLAGASAAGGAGSEQPMETE